MEWIKQHRSAVIGIGILFLGFIAIFFFLGQKGAETSAPVKIEAVAVGLVRLPEKTEETFASEAEPEPEKEGLGSAEEAAEQKGTEQEDAGAINTEPVASAQTTAVEGASDASSEQTDTFMENTEEGQAPAFSCTISISCADVLDHMDTLNPAKVGIIPENGYILGTTTVSVTEGETVYDVLRRTCMNAGIPLDANYFPMYGSAYVKGINNLYEFDCGNLSGWKFSVNGIETNYGCSAYILKEGDSIQWDYICNMNE